VRRLHLINKMLLRGGSYPRGVDVQPGSMHREAHSAAHRRIDNTQGMVVWDARSPDPRDSSTGKVWLGRRDGLSRLVRPSPRPTQSDRMKKMSRTGGLDDGETDIFHVNRSVNAMI